MEAVGDEAGSDLEDTPLAGLSCESSISSLMKMWSILSQKKLSSHKRRPHHKWIRTIKKPKLFLPLTRNNAIRNRSQLWRNWSGPRYTSLPVYYFNWGIFTILKHFHAKSHWNSVGGPSFTFLDGREQCLYRHTSNRCHKTQFNFIVVHRFFAPFGFAAKVKKKRMAFQKQLCSKVCLFHFLLSK